MAEDANKVVQYLRLPSNAKKMGCRNRNGYFAVILALSGNGVLTGEPEFDNSTYAKNDWFGNSQKVSVDHLMEYALFSYAHILHQWPRLIIEGGAFHRWPFSHCHLRGVI